MSVCIILYNAGSWPTHKIYYVCIVIPNYLIRDSWALFMKVIISFSALFKAHLTIRIFESNCLSSCIEKTLSREGKKYGSDCQAGSKQTFESLPLDVYP